MTLLLAAILAAIPAVYGRTGMGHLCPVSAEEAFTAEHVSTEPEPIGGRFMFRQLIFVQRIDGQEATGVVREVSADRTRDLSRVRIVKGDKFLQWFPIARLEPAKGDKVFIVGFDWDKGATPGLVEAKVLHSEGPMLWYDKNAGPGSSGSCVLTAQKEVVAVNVGYIITDTREIGRGVSVWGRWQRFLLPEGEENEEGEE
jgi:hypothetical protein